MGGLEKLWTGVGVGVALGFLVAIGVNAAGDRQPTPGIEAPSNSPPSIDVSARHTTTTKAIARAAPAVVSISTEQPPTRLFGRSPSRSGDGSGVLIDTEGVILTNAHVVSSASRIIATFSDGSQAEARVLGLDDELDLAVLKIPIRPGLEAVDIGSSSDLLLGEPVIAIGNPFGLGHTVTTGVVSATARALETDDRVFQDFIQTDASINPGNSGGPLLDRFGALVGITTSIRPDAEGIGFAIPIDRAIKVARDLVEVGTVRIPWLGAVLEDVRLRVDGRPRVAPVVTDTLALEGTDALEVGDVITHAGGRAIQGRADLNAFLAGLTPDEAVTLTVIRDDQVMAIEAQTSAFSPRALPDILSVRMGLDLAERPRSRSLIIAGVKGRGSAGQIGLRRGDIIIAVDGVRAGTTEDFRSAALNALSRHRPSVLITVRRGRAQGRVALPL